MPNTLLAEPSIRFCAGEAVSNFISFHEFASAYEKTKELIKKHFYFVDKINVEIDIDPEEPEYKQILFRLFFSASPQTVFEHWVVFLPEFIKFIPYEKRRFLSIELIP